MKKHAICPRAGLGRVLVGLAIGCGLLGGPSVVSAQAGRPSETVCSDDDRDVVELATTERPRLVLHRDGRLDDRGLERPFGFEIAPGALADGPAVIRVERRVGGSGGSVVDSWCGGVTGGRRRFRFPAPTEDHVAVVTLVDTPRSSEAEAAETAAEARVHALTARAVMYDRTASVSARVRRLVAARQLGAAEDVVELAQARLATLEGQVGRYALCGRELAVLATGRLSTYSRQLTELAGQLNRSEVNAALTTLAAIDVPEGAGVSVEASPWDVLKYYFGAEQPTDRLAPIARFEVPLAESARVVSVSFSESELDVGELHGGDRIAVLITDVPVGQTIAYRRARGPSVQSDPAALVAQFGAWVLRSGVSGMAAAPATVPDHLYQAGEDGTCPPPTSPVRMDRGLRPIASIGSRARWMTPIEGGYRNDYLVCRGASCITEGASRNIESTIRVTPEAEHALTLLVVGGAISLPAFDGNERLGLEQDLTERGPDVVWRVDARRDVFLPHLGVMLGWRGGPFFLGAGPSLLTMNSDPLRSWMLGIGGRLPGSARNIFILGTIGFLFHPQPVDVTAGQRISVPPPAMGSPTPPPLETEEAFSLTLGLSIGLSFEVIGQLGQAVGKLVEGS